MDASHSFSMTEKSKRHSERMRRVRNGHFLAVGELFFAPFLGCDFLPLEGLVFCGFEYYENHRFCQ